MRIRTRSTAKGSALLRPTTASVRAPAHDREPLLSRVAVAILDDYQDVARSFGPWEQLEASVTVFDDHLADVERLAERLAPFDVVVAMRERTPFGAELIERLP